uniref:YeeE/YedE thiosulfate transporter family protein n=1 Tax=Thaumasiovibrio occultus TaxID=1891184 RepID=UPI001863B5F1|nr:YeeE/YedE thiosulfate transporter family protein [Thaumasiovibrio occultus]
MVKGVKEAISGKPVFLISILLSGSFMWVAIAATYLLEQPVSSNSHLPTMHSVFGGFAFGIGAAFNGGCGVSTISRFARGQVMMTATMLGWLVSWLLFAELLTGYSGKGYTVLPTVHLVSLASISMILLIVAFKSDANARKLWLSMLGIGVMGGMVFIYEPHWTPSGLLKSMALSVWNGDLGGWPRVERFYLFLCLVLGMAVAAIATKSFHIERVIKLKLLKHFLAGLFMGLGAVMAVGGNDTQLLVALPALSAAGIVTVASMVIGIYLGITIIARQKNKVG